MFAEEACSVEGTLRRVNSLVMEIKSAMAKLPHLERSYTLCLVGWTFPPTGWAKCKVDGSCRQGGIQAGCGGIFRDASGASNGEFARNLGAGSVLSAEL